MDEPMSFHAAAPTIPPRILCIGMPVRDLTFRIDELPERGFKVNASHFEEICGGNALNAAIGIVRLGGRASICGPMGDARETSAKYIFDNLAHEGIETRHIVHMPGLVTPIGPQDASPVEIIMDTIADVNRIDASSGPKAPLSTDDYKAIMTTMKGFMSDETRGLEQFYTIIKNRPRE